MDVTKDALKLALSHAIRNCNRNIYEWLEKKKRGSLFTISHTEVRGLVKNWVIRSLKDSWGQMRTDRVLREGNLVVSVDDKHNSISNVMMTNNDPGYRAVYGDIEMLKDVFNGLSYHALRYDPSDYHLDSITPVDSLYGSPIFLDLSSIENVKF